MAAFEALNKICPELKPSCGLKIVVVGASAGGLAAFTELISELPENLPVALVLLQHLPASRIYESQLRELLQSSSKLPVKWIEDGEIINRGVVYLCPQDGQVTVTAKQTFRVERCSTWSRPCADALFSSVAKCFGESAVGIVLTGALSDGAKGAEQIERAGGRVFAQDQDTAASFGMPSAAIQKGIVDFVFSPRVIAHALIAFLMAPGAESWFRVGRRASI